MDLFRPTLLALLCAATWPVVAWSQTNLTRLGEFKVNRSTAGDQKGAVVAADYDGNLIVVWTSEGGADGSGSGVVAQKYQQGGSPYLGEIQVNTTTESDQAAPSVGKAADGSFVVAWHSLDQDASGGYGIYAQRFFTEGSPDGAEFLVNSLSAASANQQNPSVAMNDSGAFVIAWSSEGQDAQASIYFQRYASDGTPLGNETLAAPATVGRREPCVAMNTSGDFVMVWRQDEIGGAGIYGRAFNADGTPKQPNPFQVKAPGGPDFQEHGSVALWDDGSFVVAWQGLGYSGDEGFAIRAQRFDATAVKVGPEIAVNSTTPQSQVDPSVAIDPTGGFAVVWKNANASISARLFDAEGTASEPEFAVNIVASDHRPNPIEGAIAFDGTGNFVVVWDTSVIEGTSSGIEAEIFYRPGQGPSPADFRVNATTFGNQTQPAVACAPDGRAVVVWKSDSSFGSGQGIYGQRLDALGHRVGAEFRVNIQTPFVERPRVAMDANANFVIVWSASPSTSGFDVLARRFSWNGLNNGSEFLVNAGGETLGEQFATGIAMLPDGRFAIGWHTDDGSNINVRAYVRFYDAAGASLQGPVWINQVNGESSPVPVANPAGGYAVTNIKYVSLIESDVYFRTYDGDGTETLGGFRVDAFDDGINENATSAFGPSGALYVVWEHREQPPTINVDDILMQKVDPTTGNTIGSSHRLNKTTAGNQSEPSISFAPNGDFFVTYRSETLDFDGDGVAIERIVPIDLPTLPEEMVLNQFSEGDQSPSGSPEGFIGQNIVGDSFGNYFSVWSSEIQDGSGFGIYATRVFITTSPFALTLDATDVTSTSATLNGAVTPHDLAVDVDFEIAESLADLGTANATIIPATPGHFDGGINTPQTVSGTANGLSLGSNGANKAYHYRTRVTAGMNVIYGEPALFETFNGTPVAVEDTVFVPGQTVTFQPNLNDADDQGAENLTVEILIPLGDSIGTVTADGNTLTFRAGKDFDDRATFTYRVIDPFGQQSNEATVTLIRFAAVAGKYEGLINGSAGTGTLSIAINRTSGNFTGVLLFNGTRTPLEGRFEPDGEIITPINGTALVFSLKLNDQGEITGELRDATNVVMGLLALDMLDGGGEPDAVQSGMYTTFLEIEEEEEPPVAGFAARGAALEPVRPGGFGFFLTTIAKSKLRQGRFVGSLPDGTKTSAGSAGLSKNKRYVVSKPLYMKGKRFGGSITGQPSFGVSNNRFSAKLTWTKEPRPADVFFPQGFSNLQVLLAAIRFVRTPQPITFDQVLNPNALLNFSRGGFVDTPFAAYRINRQNRASVQADANNLLPKLTIPVNSPFFRGTFVHPVTNQRVKFSGIFKQKQLPSDTSEGRAFFRTTEPDGEGGTRGVTGRVRLLPL